MAGEANKGAAAQVALDEQKLKEAVAQAYETWRQGQVNNAYEKMLGATLSEEVPDFQTRDGYSIPLTHVNQLRQLTGAFGDPYKYMGEYSALSGWRKNGFTEVSEPTLGDIAVQYEMLDKGFGTEPYISSAGMYNGKTTGRDKKTKYYPWISTGNYGGTKTFSQAENHSRDYSIPKNLRYYRFTGTDEDKARIQKETEDRLRSQVAEVQARKDDWEANAPMEAPRVANVPVNDLTPEPVMTTEQWLAKMSKRR